MRGHDPHYAHRRIMRSCPRIPRVSLRLRYNSFLYRQFAALVDVVLDTAEVVAIHREQDDADAFGEEA